MDNLRYDSFAYNQDEDLDSQDDTDGGPLFTGDDEDVEDMEEDADEEESM